MPKNNFASIESIINIAKKGGMFILVDDEKRENEGDLIISTSNSNAKNINFMAKYGRGLICLALDSVQAKRLNLTLMSDCFFNLINFSFLRRYAIRSSILPIFKL